MRSLTTTEIKRLNRDWRRRTAGTVSLALVSLSNPFNVGSIYRTAATLGADTVYLVGATPTPQEAKVRKTSMGTEKAVQTVQLATLAEVAEQVHAHGGVMTAVELAEGAVAIHEHVFPDDVCLVLGSEGHGLPPAALSHCDNVVFVAQPGKVASLNVSVAASLALYEVRRQLWVATAKRERDAAP
jgi:tRNA (guanosine-2'-O-)-methyltransferase